MSKRKKVIRKDNKIYTSIRIDINVWRRVNQYRNKPNESFSDALEKILDKFDALPIVEGGDEDV